MEPDEQLELWERATNPAEAVILWARGAVANSIVVDEPVEFRELGVGPLTITDVGGMASRELYTIRLCKTWYDAGGMIQTKDGPKPWLGFPPEWWHEMGARAFGRLVGLKGAYEQRNAGRMF